MARPLEEQKTLPLGQATEPLCVPPVSQLQKTAGPAPGGHVLVSLPLWQQQPPEPAQPLCS